MVGRLQALLARIKWPSCVLSLFRRLQRESQKKKKKKDYSQFLPQFPLLSSVSPPCPVQDNPANQKRSLLHSSLPASDAPVQGLYHSVMYEYSSTVRSRDWWELMDVRYCKFPLSRLSQIMPCGIPSMMTPWHAISLTRNNTSQEKKKRRRRKPPLRVLFPSLSPRRILFFSFFHGKKH